MIFAGEGMSPEDKHPRTDSVNGGSADRDVLAGADTTLGGYMREHSRPPAFEGMDGEPYSVSPEVEKTPNLGAPYEGYLVFPRWAVMGLGVVAHLETPTLLAADSPDAVLEKLGEIPLLTVKKLLDDAIRRAKLP